MDNFAPLESSFEPELTSLFRDERLPMTQMASLMVGSWSLAEEIVQDAFVTVGQRWDTLERPGGYLRTVVVHGCSQTLRRRAAEDRAQGRLHRDETTEIPTHLIELRDALDTLNERQRIVVVLRYFVDVGDDEIAEILNARPATIRSLAHRAFRQLRKELP